MPQHDGYVFVGWDEQGDIITAMYRQYGDVNDDGKINTADAVQILRYAAGMMAFDNAQNLSSDCNHDGKVNIGDAVLILRYAVGLITKF